MWKASRKKQILSGPQCRQKTECYRGFQKNQQVEELKRNLEEITVNKSTGKDLPSEEQRDPEKNNEWPKETQAHTNPK